jgi:hypothetical protein
MPQMLMSIALLLVLAQDTQFRVFCSHCSPPPPTCVAFNSTPIVFVGLVESIESIPVRNGRDPNDEGRFVHVVVEEVLKGTLPSELTLASYLSERCCGIEFQTNERYLVYAYRSANGDFVTDARRSLAADQNPHASPRSLPYCNRTKSLERAQDEVEMVRALVTGQPQTRITGGVMEFRRVISSGYDQMKEAGPMAGVSIMIESGHSKQEVITDSRGRYRLLNPLPGKYLVSIVLPENYGLVSADAAEIEVTTEACQAEVDFNIRIDGRISGRIFSSDGKPISEEVTVSIITQESAGKDFQEMEVVFESTDEDGYYEFTGLPPGRYLLGICIAHPPDVDTPYPPVYYPGRSESSFAKVIDLKSGEELGDLDLGAATKNAGAHDYRPCGLQRWHTRC